LGKKEEKGTKGLTQQVAGKWGEEEGKKPWVNVSA